MSDQNSNQSPSPDSIPSPINLPRWLRTNSHLLQPPINNTCLYRSHGLTIMLVGGPNARSDFHINPTPEWFYQYSGSMLLRIAEPPPIPSNPPSQTPPSIPTTTPNFRDIHISESEMFLLPPNIPHSPIRFANTVGIVIELDRPEGLRDCLRWYCPRRECGETVFEAWFRCEDLGSQVKEVVEGFVGRGVEERRCGRCGVGVAGEKAVV